MRLFVLALVFSLAAVALTVGASSTRAAPPTQTPPAIVDYSVQVGGTSTDPETGLTYRGYTFTIEFTHQRGLIGVQVNEYPAGSTEKTTLNGTVFRETTIGTDTLSVQLGALISQPVYFKLFLFKPGHWVGKPPGEMKGEVIYDTRTTGTYSG